MASKPAGSGLRWGLVEFWPRLVGIGGVLSSHFGSCISEVGGRAIKMETLIASLDHFGPWNPTTS